MESLRLEPCFKHTQPSHQAIFLSSPALVLFCPPECQSPQEAGAGPAAFWTLPACTPQR